MSGQEKRYQLVHPISVSTKSTVYYGTLSGFGSFKKDIAIKVFRNLDDKETQAMIQKAKVWATLSHTNIVQLLDLGQSKNIWYASMELVDGPNLGQIIEDMKQNYIKIEFPCFIYIISEILHALDYAHSKNHPIRKDRVGIAHENLGLDCILLDESGNVKILGFEGQKSNINEQMSNDVYQIGRLMSHMYNDIADCLEKQSLYDIIAQACHSDPMKRYRSARFLLETIQKLFPPEPKAQSKLRRLMLGLYPPLEDFDEDVPTIVSRTVRSSEVQDDITLTAGDRILSETTIELITATESPSGSTQQSLNQKVSERGSYKTQNVLSMPTFSVVYAIGFCVVSLFAGFFLGKRSQTGELYLQIETVGESHLSFPKQEFLLLPNRKQRVELSPDFVDTSGEKCTTLDLVIFDMQSDIPIQMHTTSK